MTYEIPFERRERNGIVIERAFVDDLMIDLYAPWSEATTPQEAQFLWEILRVGAPAGERSGYAPTRAEALAAIAVARADFADARLRAENI